MSKGRWAVLHSWRRPYWNLWGFGFGVGVSLRPLRFYEIALLLGPFHFHASIVYSVCDFGAVGDGVTDDTAAIQAAIHARRWEET